MTSAVDLFNKTKGVDFVRTCMAMMSTRGDMWLAADVAAGRWGPSSVPARVLKTAVIAGSLTPGSDWGEQLAAFRGMAAEFFDAVMARSIVGSLVGRRAVPLKTRLLSIASGAGASWVGEGKAKPVSKLEFSTESLDPYKIVSTVVVSRQLLESNDPRSENFIRTDMQRALIELLDASFIDPSFTGTAGESPASITNGATSVGGSDDPDTDIANLLAAFEGDLTTAYLVASAYAGAAASSESMPNAGARGGEIFGIPLITSTSVPDGVVALIDAAGIAVAEGDLAARTATSAAMQLDDAPTVDATTGTGTNLVSLFQTNSVALLVEKTINWQAIRTGAVAYIDGATWAVGVSQT